MVLCFTPGRSGQLLDDNTGGSQESASMNVLRYLRRAMPRFELTFFRRRWECGTAGAQVAEWRLALWQWSGFKHTMRYLGYMSQCQHHCVSQCQLSLNAQKSNKKTEIFLSFLEQTTTAVEMFFKNVASQCKQLTAQAFTSFDFGRLRLQQVASVSIWNSQKNEQRFLYRHTVTHWGRSETVSGTAVSQRDSLRNSSGSLATRPLLHQRLQKKNKCNFLQEFRLSSCHTLLALQAHCSSALLLNLRGSWANQVMNSGERKSEILPANLAQFSHILPLCSHPGALGEKALSLSKETAGVKDSWVLHSVAKAVPSAPDMNGNKIWNVSSTSKWWLDVQNSSILALLCVVTTWLLSLVAACLDPKTKLRTMSAEAFLDFGGDTCHGAQRPLR